MIRDRIKQYLDYKGLSKYKFYKALSLSNGFLDKDGNIGSDKCEQIISYYNDINPEWLLTGKGKMLKEKEPDESEDIHLYLSKDDIEDIKILSSISGVPLKSKDDKIIYLSEQIELLQKLNQKYVNEIHYLKFKIDELRGNKNQRRRSA